MLHQDFFWQNIIPWEYGKIINRLFDLRQKSDYQVTAPVDPVETKEVWNQACDFVRVVKAYLAEQGFLSANDRDNRE